MENDVIQPATHSEEVTTPPANPQADEAHIAAMKDVYASFGLEYPAENEDKEGNEDDAQEGQESDPPTDGDAGQEEPKKGITVKYNGQDVFIPEEEVAAHARKGLNYDKIEGRAKQYESALDRLARQQGFKDHADLLANLDAIEQKQLQQQRDQFDALKKQLRDDAEAAGIDPNILDQYLDNHPLLKQAREVVERSEQEQQRRQQEQTEQQLRQGWEALFRKYPGLTDQVDAETGTAAWLTPEMQSRLQRGYDPIDAYELVHRDSIIADERKRAEQSVIKNQRLNKRAQVEKGGSADLEPNAPEELTSAFKLFGLDPNKAQKYAKNFE